MFKRIKTVLAKRKKLVLILGTSLLVLGAAGGGTALWLSSRMTPEKLFYESLALGPQKNVYSIEKVVGTKAGNISSEGIYLEDGTTKGTAKLECSAATKEYGRTDLKLTVQQFDGSVLMRYDELRFSDTPDKEWEASWNETFSNQIVGKWILLEDDDSVFEAYKEFGVRFELIETVSNKLSAKEIANKMQESKAITIMNSREVTRDGVDAVEYDLMIRRSAYERFMDSVEPRYREKDGVLDTMFLSDAEELTVTVDRNTKRIISVAYTMDNLCATFISEVDEDAANELPKKMTMVRTSSPKGTADQLTKPTEQMTMDELYQILYPEE